MHTTIGRPTLGVYLNVVVFFVHRHRHFVVVLRLLEHDSCPHDRVGHVGCGVLGVLPLLAGP